METKFSSIPAKKINDAHYRLWAIKHSKRMAIVNHLYLVGCANVTDLTIHFRTRQDVMSQNLMILRKAGYLMTERMGQHIYYSVDEEALSNVYKALKRFAGK